MSSWLKTELSLSIHYSSIAAATVVFHQGPCLFCNLHKKETCDQMGGREQIIQK